jgi:uncharacterized protein YbjT (DUF2867 family)
VAELVAQAALDPSYRGRVLEIGGPRDLSLNELAALSREIHGRPARVRHLPRTALRMMAPLHRQPKAALVMDTSDMTFRPRHDGRSGTTDPRDALVRATATT